MYGRGGSGEGAAGGAAVAAGAAVLPVTGGNVVLIALSIATIVAGLLVTASFIAARVANKLAR